MVGVWISNLTHEFDGREVFAGLDFAHDGGCLAVTGPNGSGKSTLLRILGGLLTPDCGEAYLSVDGVPLTRRRARSAIGLAAPDVKLYSELSARENLLFLLRARGLDAIEDRASSALEQVGLLGRGSDPLSELSSGMRQRAALAAAIAHDPLVLLLDEPSSNLDEPGVSMLREVIAKRQKDGLVVLATNDPTEAAIASERLDLGGRQ